MGHKCKFFVKILSTVARLSTKPLSTCNMLLTYRGSTAVKHKESGE